ncbi:MAG: hypothetical protein MUE71_09900, partial [Chitinophagaceae bacterium]|nr:hypothetical protein [Chitinophagaceae bacterium]
TLWLKKSDYWSWLCLATILISQVLIFTVWKDAKFGTVANLILLAVAWPAYGQMRFHEMLHAEQTALLSSVPAAGKTLITEKDLESLPPIVAQWLRNSGAVGKPRITGARLTQTGKMKLKPESNWFDFTATQYFNIAKPAFIWNTRVSMPANTYMIGRDKFENGKGAMQIKLLSLINIVNEKDNPALNTGTAQRYLAEMCWFPTAAIEPYIKWTNMDSLNAKATLSLHDLEVEGVFTFNPEGDFVRFETIRYYGSGSEAVQAPWIIQPTAYKVMSGFRVPYKNRVTWNLDKGNFTWLELELTSLEYDSKEFF